MFGRSTIEYLPAKLVWLLRKITTKSLCKFKLAEKNRRLKCIFKLYFLSQVSSHGFQTCDFCWLFSAAATHEELVNVEVGGWTENVA